MSALWALHSLRGGFLQWDSWDLRRREHSTADLHFAADSSEIFTDIYNSYTNAVIGGSYVQPEPPDSQVFGDILVTGGNQFGSFSDGNTLWTAEPDAIEVCDLSGSADKIEILPPDGAQFVRVEFTGSGLTAVFTGDSFCGVMGADQSGSTWTTKQSGKLTDIYSPGGRNTAGKRV